MGSLCCAEERNSPKDCLKFMSVAEVVAAEKDGKLKWTRLDCSNDENALEEYTYQRMRDAVFFDFKAF